MELVDKIEQQTQQDIADNLNQAGQKVTAKDVSAEYKFPLKDLEELGGEALGDVTEFAKATTEGSNYVRTTPSKNIIVIAKQRLLGKKAE